MGQYPAQTLFLANFNEPLMDIWRPKKWKKRFESKEFVIGLLPDSDPENLAVLISVPAQPSVDPDLLSKEWFPQSDIEKITISGNEAIRIITPAAWMEPISDATEMFTAIDKDILLVASSEDALKEWWSNSPRLGETEGFVRFASSLPANGIPVGYGSAGIAKWLIAGEEIKTDSHLAKIYRILYDYVDDVGIWQKIRSDGFEIETISGSDLSLPANIAILASLTWESASETDYSNTDNKIKKRKMRGGFKNRRFRRK